MKNTFTYNGLVSEIKRCESGIMGTHLPMLSMHYIEFVQRAGLDVEKYPTIQHYIKHASYDEKKNIFTPLGFHVLYLTLSAVKVSHFARGRAKGQEHLTETLEEQFLNKQRNAFILCVEAGLDNLYFILEYNDPEHPLADETIDWDELRREKERQEKLRSIFFKNK